MQQKQNHWAALGIIACLFFVFGFITWSNSQLIPYLKIACQLSDTESYYVASAFFAAYFFMSIPSSYVLGKTGFKKGMSLGLLIMALGALLFIPAAQQRLFPLFLSGLFIIGTGLALLQTASNPYATILGPIESAAQRISIMGICNKIAGIISIYVLGSITLKNADEIKAKVATLPLAEKNIELDALASRVITPYIVISIALCILAIIIYFSKLPEIQEESDANVGAQDANQRDTIWAYPHLLLGVLAIFFYVGVEVISYDTFTGLGEHLGYSLDTSKTLATYTGYALLVGYILGIIAIPKYISQQKALFVFTSASIILVVISMYSSGITAIIAFALLGLTNSVVWPAIWPLAIQKLGKHTKLGSALLVMGIVGGAVLPPLYAQVATWLGSAQKAYIIMIPCYIYILYYAKSGHKLGLK